MNGRPCEVCGSTAFLEVLCLQDYHLARCRACGLERLDPQPPDQVLASIYSKSYYEAWGLHLRPKLVHRVKTATFKRRLQSIPGLLPGSRVLDCGAATGILMELA